MAGLKVVVTGGSGVLGTALRDVRPRWTYLSRSECDVRDFRAVYRTLKSLSPDIVLHTAALTDHAHPNAAEIIDTNIIGTQIVTTECDRLGIPMAYTSTHYVYGGVRGNYAETDAEAPIGAYAMSKLAGEVAAATLGHANCLIVRGSWYTRETRLEHWARRGALVDAWCSREPVADAARKIIALIDAGVRGVVNIGGEPRTFDQILYDEGYENFPKVSRADIDDTALAPYTFPPDTSVDTAKFEALGLDWRGV